mgnify:CR=1 FL=1
MAKDIKTYHEQTFIEDTLRLREILTTLPAFAKDYFRAMEPTTSAKTRISYAYDIRTFFYFLVECNPLYRDRSTTQFTLEDLDQLSSVDIEEYLEYLKVYESSENKQITNSEQGLARKMSALRSFYGYFFKRQAIEKNPTLLVDMPKLHEKAIIRLDTDEVAILLDYIETCGSQLTGQKKVYYEKTKYRDLAIITLLLGTGIRVSECVGIDISNLDFETNGMKIHRKGGADVILYFGEEVREALLDYLEEREKIIPKEGSENALFLSMQKRRISVRAVENLVKKYARPVTPLKTITPHKLRSTYGTQLYQETGDIYLVADVLGHKDVNTTRKHYAAMEDQRRRMAAGKIQLREK